MPDRDRAPLIRARIVLAFDDFRLDVDLTSDGPVLGLFGRSGSGKTTLLRRLKYSVQDDAALSARWLPLFS